MRFGGWCSGIVAAAIGLTALGSPSLAEAPKYSTQIASLAFLVGDWVADKGHSEGVRINRGSFTIEPVAGGTALLRRDYTDVFDSKGKKLESFDQVMLIYPEDGKPRADYFDGTHPIHYTSVEIDPGRSVRFETAAQGGAPTFRLTYTKTAENNLSIKFEMSPPGQTVFQEVAVGTAHRQ